MIYINYESSTTGSWDIFHVPKYYFSYKYSREKLYNDIKSSASEKQNISIIINSLHLIEPICEYNISIFIDFKMIFIFY